MSQEWAEPLAIPTRAEQSTFEQVPFWFLLLVSQFELKLLLLFSWMCFPFSRQETVARQTLGWRQGPEKVSENACSHHIFFWLSLTFSFFWCKESGKDAEDACMSTDDLLQMKAMSGRQVSGGTDRREIHKNAYLLCVFLVCFVLFWDQKDDSKRDKTRGELAASAAGKHQLWIWLSKPLGCQAGWLLDMLVTFCNPRHVLRLQAEARQRC